MMSTIATDARNMMADELKRTKATIDGHENDVSMMKSRVQEFKNKKMEAEVRHDEMFNSVSMLNSRIEELEMHKIVLLQKLKNHGDKTSIDHLVKSAEDM